MFSDAGFVLRCGGVHSGVVVELVMSSSMHAGLGMYFACSL